MAGRQAAFADPGPRLRRSCRGRQKWIGDDGAKQHIIEKGIQVVG